MNLGLRFSHCLARRVDVVMLQNADNSTNYSIHDPVHVDPSIYLTSIVRFIVSIRYA
jgi:hypothetical protein